MSSMRNNRVTNKLVPGVNCFGAAVLLLAFPALHACVLIANFVGHLFVLGLQLVTTRLPRISLPERRRIRREPFVSIHVPALNEPPELLIQTLRSLSRIKWSHYEVLVIDNNTSDPQLWRPVAEMCRELGQRFRFFHVENLEGFKAGALNYVRRFMDPAADFIFVVDADYVVERDCLRRALAYCTDPNIGLIQFPQEYRNIGPGNCGVALDFKHFFAAYMNMANRLECVPSTGTLSLINVAALRAVDGFSEQMITEDADLGVRLALRGYKCIYIHEVIGYGLLRTPARRAFPAGNLAGLLHAPGSGMGFQRQLAEVPLEPSIAFSADEQVSLPTCARLHPCGHRRAGPRLRAAGSRCRARRLGFSGRPIDRLPYVRRPLRGCLDLASDASNVSIDLRVAGSERFGPAPGC